MVCGEDEYSVKLSAKRVYTEWCAQAGGFDHEIVDASAANSSEAIKSVARVVEALQTLPFFGGSKVVWMQNVNFLGDERASSTHAVTEALAGLAEVLKSMKWEDVRLVVSAGKVDRRKIFYKTLEKLGRVELHGGLSMDDRDWVMKAESIIRLRLKECGRSMSDAGVSGLIESVGPNVRQLINEIEKLSVYRGDGARIEASDVEAVVSRQRQAKAFALSEAVGERDLPRALRLLEEELWSMKTDSKKSEIGLLYGLISKVRLLLLVKEFIRLGHLRTGLDYGGVSSALSRIPPETFPSDLPFNPLKMHPFQILKALGQASSFGSDELTRALGLLLDCNRQLVMTDLDEVLVLQRVLIGILGEGSATKKVGREKLKAER